MTGRSVYPRFLAVFGAIGTLGLAASAYVLVQQRIPLPFKSSYRIAVDLAAADGLISGLGQPVNVAGVKVGQVEKIQLLDGRARVVLRIDRERLPVVHRNARAALEPISPLKDLQIELDPGREPSPPMREHDVLDVAATTAPAPVADLLGGLDLDTRTYLQSLIASIDEGTRGRAADIADIAALLGPTTAQARGIADALAARRRELARLVTNLGRISRAASRDDRLRPALDATDVTFAALARQEKDLRRSLRLLAPTLEQATRTVNDLGPFARRLAPAVKAIDPAMDRLPGALDALDRLATATTPLLRRDVRPLVREARPLLRRLRKPVRQVDRALPDLSRVAQVARYALNELAYNPPGDDEGLLFWLAWFAHNINSVASSGDAHGGIGRALPLVSCEGVQSIPDLQAVLGVAGLCPE